METSPSASSFLGYGLRLKNTASKYSVVIVWFGYGLLGSWIDIIDMEGERLPKDIILEMRASIAWAV